MSASNPIAKPAPVSADRDLEITSSFLRLAYPTAAPSTEPHVRPGYVPTQDAGREGAAPESSVAYSARRTMYRLHVRSTGADADPVISKLDSRIPWMVGRRTACQVTPRALRQATPQTTLKAIREATPGAIGIATRGTTQLLALRPADRATGRAVSQATERATWRVIPAAMVGATGRATMVVAGLATV